MYLNVYQRATMLQCINYNMYKLLNDFQPVQSICYLSCDHMIGFVILQCVNTYDGMMSTADLVY